MTVLMVSTGLTDVDYKLRDVARRWSCQNSPGRGPRAMDYGSASSLLANIPISR
jgi:hypothetical protein